MAKLKLPEVADWVEYRVLKNPVTAAERDYVARAYVMEVFEDGSLQLVVTPKRADPFQIGPVPHYTMRPEDSESFSVWM